MKKIKASLQINHQNDKEIKIKKIHNQKRKVKTWTQQQDSQLIYLYNRYPKKWNKIASQMNNRNQNQCLHRFRRLSQQKKHQKIWSNQEDQKVLQLYEYYGNNWKMIAMNIKSKTGKQIRERFINKLDPQIKKQEFTQNDDIKIIQLLTKFGTKWSQISKHLPGRPQNKIKNRYYSYIQKNYDIQIIKQQNQKKQYLLEDKQKDSRTNNRGFQLKGKDQQIKQSQFQNDYQTQQKQYKQIEGSGCKNSIQKLKSLQQQQINESNFEANQLMSNQQFHSNEDFLYFQRN